MPSRKPKKPSGGTPSTPTPVVPGKGRSLSGPVFGQPQPTPDPGQFRVTHASDGQAYKAIDALNRLHQLHAMPFPAPRGLPEPRLTLDEVLGGNAAVLSGIQKAGQIVFHSLGDCGSTRGPQTEVLVTDKLVSDFTESDPAEIPQFNLLLGDIVYSFGESQYYYDQFYEPYRDYPAPILAAAGNHDGMVSPLGHAQSLEAFLRNFCAASFVVTPEAGGLSRTAQIQPGVFFTFEAPFVRILVLYSNTLEDPGVISDSTIGKSQLDFLMAALTRVKEEHYTGALLFAHHHPAYTAGSTHGWSVDMQNQIDALCTKTGVWPHADLAGHAHSYQRFTRTRNQDGTQIPYIVCGNGGHNVQALTKPGTPAIRARSVIQPKSASADQVVLENYDDQDYGYLRVTASEALLQIEYHPAVDGAGTKAPDDRVAIDLATRRLVSSASMDGVRPPPAARLWPSGGTRG